MDAQTETTTASEEKHSFNWRAFILWPSVILILYVLSAGPVVMVVRNETRGPRLELVKKVYFPVLWAYFNTPLHKPLGLYFDLWVPERFDNNGEVRID